MRSHTSRRSAGETTPAQCYALGGYVGVRSDADQLGGAPGLLVPGGGRGGLDVAEGDRRAVAEPAAGLAQLAVDEREGGVRRGDRDVARSGAAAGGGGHAQFIGHVRIFPIGRFGRLEYKSVLFGVVLPDYPITS